MFMNRTGRILREGGDTIVEVLIAIAVVSLILGGAYVTTNRSLQATRSAEERSVALKLAESQVEQIKALSKTDPGLIFDTTTPNPFCIGTGGTPIATTSNQCKVNSAGAPTTNEPRFSLSVTRGSDGHTFTVVNQWTDVSGDVTDNVRMLYRVYE